MNPTDTDFDTAVDEAISLSKERESLFPALTRLDRCDSCGAAAQTVTQVSPDHSMIYLCGHHFRKHRAHFDEKGYPYLLNDDIRRDVLFELPAVAGANKPYAGVIDD